MSHKSSEVLKMMGVLADPVLNNSNFHLQVHWGKIKNRINTHPEEAVLSPLPCPPLQFALVNDFSPVPAHVVKVFLRNNPLSFEKLWYKIAVIAICQNRVICGDVLQMFLQEGPKDTLVTAIRNNLLPFAIQSGNADVLSVLIDHFPGALSEMFGPSSEIPLHSCCHIHPQLLSLLINKGIVHDVGGESDVGGLFVENIHGDSPFDMLVQSLLTSDARGKGYRSVAWKRIEVCLQYISVVRRTNIKKDPRQILDPSGICFSGVAFLPSELLDEAIVNLNFAHASSDIFNLIDIATTSCDKWKNRLKLRASDLAKAFRIILSSRGMNMTQTVTETKRSSPLHFGALKGLRWCEGLEEIVLADYNVLAEPDKMTGFIPFIAAANGSSKDLTTVYQILRSDPSQVSLYTNNDKKR